MENKKKPQNKPTKKKANFSGTIAIIAALLVLAVFVPINLIVSYNDKVFDMTPAKQYTLNSKTVELLDSTSDKDIEVFFLLDSLKEVKEDPSYLALYHTLDELRNRDNISLTCFDPDKEPAQAKELDPSGFLGVERGDVFVKCGETIKRVAHNKIYQTKDKKGEIVEYAGEELIAGAIQVCTAGSLQTMYFLTGHGEKSINDEYKNYVNTVKSDNYDVAELNLDETGAIPGNTAALWIAGPQKDLTDKEYTLVSGYLEQGGSVAILAGPCDTEGRFKNFDKLLKTYGLEMDYNIVSEGSPSNQFKDHDDVQNPNYFRVTFPLKTDDFTQDLTTDLNTLIYKKLRVAGIYNTRSFGLLPESQYNAEKIEVCSIIRNSADSEGNYSTVSKAMGGDKDTQDYANNKLNNKELDLGFYAYDRISGGKLFVVGSNDIIDSNLEPKYLSSEDEYASKWLVIFANTWLFDNDVQMGIGNKVTAYDTMEFKDASEAKRLMGLTALLPAAILLFGICVWLKRRHA